MKKWYSLKLKAIHFCYIFFVLWATIQLLDHFDNQHDLIFESKLAEIKADDLDNNLDFETSFVLFVDEESSISRQMEYNMNELAKLYNNPVRFYKVKVSEYNDICSKYQLTGVPSTLVFKEGKEVKRIVGIVPLSNLKMISRKIN